MSRAKGSTNKPKAAGFAEHIPADSLQPRDEMVIPPLVDSREPPQAGDSNTANGVTIATRFDEPSNQYVWDVSYTLDGTAYTDSGFHTGPEAEDHAAMIFESYGDRLK